MLHAYSSVMAVLHENLLPACERLAINLANMKAFTAEYGDLL